MKKGLILLGFVVSFAIVAAPVIAPHLLFTANEDDMWDAFVMNFTGVENQTNYGSNSDLRVEGNQVAGTDTIIRRSYMKFNITEIPNGSVIDEANLYLFQEAGTGAVMDTEIHQVRNDSWSELNITWNNQPCGWNHTDILYPSGCNASVQDTQNTGTGASGWHEWDITEIIRIAKHQGLNNVSIMVSQDAVPAAQEYRYYASRNNGNANRRPIMNVTYGPPTNVTVIVLSSVETINDTTCPMNYVNGNWVSFHDTTYDPNDTADVCYPNQCSYEGVSYPYCAYEFTEVPEGTHTLNVSRPDHKYFSQEYSIEATFEIYVIPAWLEPYGTVDIFVTVRNSTRVISDAKVSLYASNGTLAQFGQTWNWNPQYTTASGSADWQVVPEGSYYFIIEADAHSRLITQSFFIRDDFNQTFSLTPTNKRINITVDNTTGVLAQNYNFTATFTAIPVPYNFIRVRVRRPDGTEMELTTHRQVNPFWFELFGRSWFQHGTNVVWVVFEDVTSNELFIEVTEEAGEETTESPMVDFTPYGAGLSFLNVIFTPFAILYGALVGIGAALEMRIRARGTAFFGVILMGSLAGGYLGIFPLWVSVGTMIICAFMIAKFTMKLI